MPSQKIIRQIETINFVNIFVGLYCISLLSFFFPISNSRDITTPYRAISFVLSLIVIILNRKKKIQVTMPLIIVLVFFAMYLTRMITDFYLKKLPYSDPGYEYILVFICSGITSAISLLFTQIDKISLRVFIFQFIFLLVFGVLNILLLNNYYHFGRSRGITYLSPGTFGLIGSILSIFSTYLLFTAKKWRYNKIYSLSAYVGLVFGIIIIYISGSKAPAAILLLLLPLFIIFNYIKQYRQKLILISSAFLIAVIPILIFEKLQGSWLFDRVSESVQIEDASTIERLHLLRIALDNIKHSSLLGSGLFLQDFQYYSTYPHNLFVESFMTTGFLGGVLYSFFILYILRIAFLNIKNSNYSWISLLFLIYFIFSIFFGSLYASSFLWASSFALMNIENNKTKTNTAYSN